MVEWLKTEKGQKPKYCRYFMFIASVLAVTPDGDLAREVKSNPNVLALHMNSCQKGEGNRITHRESCFNSDIRSFCHDYY